jgi:hypothetical protein
MVTNSKEYNKKVYHRYWWTISAIRDRVKRNAARRLMVRKNKVKDWDKTMEVDHKKWIEWGNWSSNLRVISRIKNRILWQKKAMKNRVHKYNV